MKVTHYDLFAGIGGFSLALDTIFHEQKNQHIFCEWEAFPTAVLRKHWPEGTYYGDIADLVANTRQQLRESWRSEGVEASTTIGTTSTETNQRKHQYTWTDDWREVALATCHDGVDDGLPRRMDGVAISAARYRKERLKACGNAIVPQVAMEIFKSIKNTL